MGEKDEYCVSSREMDVFKPFELEYNDKGRGEGSYDPVYTDKDKMLAAFRDLYDVVVQIVEGKPIVSEYWRKLECEE